MSDLVRKYRLFCFNDPRVFSTIVWWFLMPYSKYFQTAKFFINDVGENDLYSSDLDLFLFQ